MTRSQKFFKAFAFYLRPRPLGVIGLGIASGFPLTLLLATLGYWLRKEGIDKSTIGLLLLTTTPYTLKFLWAPIIDRVKIPLLAKLVGHRRAWLFSVQILLALAVIFLGSTNPNENIAALAWWALTVAFLSATQDIIIDAYRIEILSDDELPFGSVMATWGYRVGNLIAGAGTIAVAGFYGWSTAYTLTALCVLFGSVAALLLGEPEGERGLSNKRDGLRWDGLGQWLNEAFIGPFKQFLTRDGALLILLFVAIYKVGDAMGQVMLSPLIVELGFTDAEYIWANKVVGFWALAIGTILGPPLIIVTGMARALLITGVFMMVTNLTFAWLAVQGNDPIALAIAVGLENFASGLGLVVFVTYLSGLCNIAYTATQYALLASLAVLARTFLASPSGYLAEQIGWVGFFLFTTAIAIPGIVLLFIMWRRGFATDAIRSPGGKV